MADQKDQSQDKAEEKTKILEESGILDAYEYLLRSLCKNGLPQGNIYEYAAQQILKFERKHLQKKAKDNIVKSQQMYQKNVERKAAKQKEEEQLNQDKILVKIMKKKEESKVQDQQKEEDKSFKEEKSNKKGNKTQQEPISEQKTQKKTEGEKKKESKKQNKQEKVENVEEEKSPKGQVKGVKVKK